MTAFVHVVEDDDDLRRLLVRGLCGGRFRGRAAARARKRRCDSKAERGADAFVIDIGLEDADGRDLCQALRAQGVRAPVLFLTALDATPDRISGFRAGGDDYVTKPFAFSELVARLHALLRRAECRSRWASPGSLQLDPTRRTVACGGASVALTQTEYRILGALAGRPGADAPAPRDRRRRLARRRDREREHDRRLHRAPAAQAARAACGPGDRDRARRRLRPAMRAAAPARHPRAAAHDERRGDAARARRADGGSNAILRRSLDRDATEPRPRARGRRARDAACRRRERTQGGRVPRRRGHRRPDLGLRPARGGRRRRRPRRRSSTARPRSSPAAPRTTVDVGDTRLHAVPVVRSGEAPGHARRRRRPPCLSRDGAHGADRLDRARGAALRSRCARIPLDPAPRARAGFADDGRSRRLERAQPRPALRSR